MYKSIITLTVILILFGIIFELTKYNNRNTIIARVVDKERITTSDSDGRIDSYYLIFTENETFKLEDDLVYGNFRSSDWYGQIRKDSTYTFEVIGYRIGYLSEYQKIIAFNKY
jgi:hypothetical protein